MASPNVFNEIGNTMEEVVKKIQIRLIEANPPETGAFHAIEIVNWFASTEVSKGKPHVHLMLMLKSKLTKNTYKFNKVNGVLYNQLKPLFQTQPVVMTIQTGNYTSRVVRYLSKQENCDFLIDKEIEKEELQLDDAAEAAKKFADIVKISLEEEDPCPVQNKTDVEKKEHRNAICEQLKNVLPSNYSYSNFEILFRSCFEMSVPKETLKSVFDAAANNWRVFTPLADKIANWIENVKFFYTPLLEQGVNPFLPRVIGSSAVEPVLLKIWSWIKGWEPEGITALLLRGPKDAGKSLLLSLFFSVQYAGTNTKYTGITGPLARTNLSERLNFDSRESTFARIGSWVFEDIPARASPQTLLNIKDLIDKVRMLNCKYEDVSSRYHSVPVAIGTTGALWNNFTKDSTDITADQAGQFEKRMFDVVLPVEPTLKKIFTDQIPKPSEYAPHYISFLLYGALLYHEDTVKNLGIREAVNAFLCPFSPEPSASLVQAQVTLAPAMLDSDASLSDSLLSENL